MARPTTKNDLIEKSNSQFEKIWQIIDSLTESELMMSFNFTDSPNLKEAHWLRDKNIRDVMIHLYEWHQLLLNWISKNRSNESCDFLPKPYNWKTYQTMNIAFWEKHQITSYDESVSLLRQSHKEVMNQIESFTNEELFEKQHFAWTGTTSLGSYCVSATCSHYDWAIKKLRKHKKNINK